MIHFKPVQKSSVDCLVKLFEICFDDGKLTKKYLNWLYYENPNGHVIGYNAYHGDDLIAHYGLVPGSFDKDHQFLLSANTATHPDFMGRGLFTKLAKMTYDQASLEGYEEIIGVANKNSISVFTKKLNFRRINGVNLFLSNSFSLKFSGTFIKEINYTSHIEWRMKNPSNKYFYALSAGSSLIFCEYKGFKVLLGSCKDTNLIEKLPQKNIPGLFLVPLLGIKPPFLSFKIPGKLLPSPWHFIVRSDLMKEESYYKIFGLGMDTF